MREEVHLDAHLAYRALVRTGGIWNFMKRNQNQLTRTTRRREARMASRHYADFVFGSIRCYDPRLRLRAQLLFLEQSTCSDNRRASGTRRFPRLSRVAFIEKTWSSPTMRERHLRALITRCAETFSSGHASRNEFRRISSPNVHSAYDTSVHGAGDRSTDRLVRESLPRTFALSQENRLSLVENRVVYTALGNE